MHAVEQLSPLAVQQFSVSIQRDLSSLKVRTVDKLSAGSLLSNQARTLKTLKMERHRRGQQTDPFADDAGRKALRAALDQKSLDREPMFMCQSAQGIDDQVIFHYSYEITRILVM